MRPIKLRMKHVGPFDEATVDFASVPGNIIAVSGKTGQGKTMTIESVFAAHHRNFPSRPDSIYKYCRGKDAQIELEFSNKGIPYRALLNIDAVASEMEAHLFQGEVPLNDGKNKTFKEAIWRLFGSEALILASSFSAQNHQGSFTSLPRADRKVLFIAMIGQEQLEKIHKMAKEERDACDKEYAALAEKRENLQQILVRTVPHRIAIEERIRVATTELVEAEGLLKERLAYLSMEKARIQTGAGAGERKKNLGSKKKELSDKLEAIKSNREGALRLAASLENLRLVAEGIDKEKEELQALRAQIEDWRSEVSEHEALENEYLKATKNLQSDIAAHQKDQEVAKTKVERAEKDVKIIKRVPCKAEGDFAKCEFLVNAVEGRDSIDPLNGLIDGARARCLALNQELSSLIKPDGSIKVALRKTIMDAQPKTEKITASIRTKEDAKAKIPQAEAAAGMVADYDKNIEITTVDLKTVTADLAVAEAEDLEIENKKKSLKGLQAQVDMQDELVSSIRDRISTSGKELSQADLLHQQFEQAQKDIAPIKESIVRTDRDRRSWELLVRAFGKTGIQSLEIDVAGPEVSTIANDLLFSCIGPRFSLKFRTQKPLADGTGFQDDFDIFVHDEDRAEWCSIDDLSGGEKVIVGEAASLAIALYNRQKAGVGWETIYRDEPSSALDDENAPRYINMLKRARELGHFDQLIFISHQSIVKELADARINVSEGHISIET